MLGAGSPFPETPELKDLSRANIYIFKVIVNNYGNSPQYWEQAITSTVSK